MTGQCSPLLSPLPCFDWDEDAHLDFNAVMVSLYNRVDMVCHCTIISIRNEAAFSNRSFYRQY